VAAIFKMTTGINFSMSGINSGHHYLPTYKILMISDNVGVFKIFEMSAILKMAAKTRHKKWAVKIQHFPISSKFDMWVDNDFPMSLKSNNVEFVRYCDGHFENGDR
jgi:hypothetical protein